jgi:hypothetical protein
MRGRMRQGSSADHSEGGRTGSMNDNVASLEDLVENALLGDAPFEDDGLDLAGVLVAVLLDPRFALLRSAKRDADRVTQVEETKSDGGTDESAGARDDGEDGRGGVVVTVGHCWKWKWMK